MLARQKDIQRQPVFQPRAHLEGVKLPNGFKLPAMESVRREAKLLPEMRVNGPGEIRAMWFKDGQISTGGRQPEPLPEPLAWNTSLPNLFKFSYFTHVEDVPADLVEDVIFILKMFVRVLTESTEKQLRDIGHYLPHQKAEVAQYFMLANTRFKLVTHLMNYEIDRPEEALDHLKAGAQADINQLRSKGIREDPIENNPYLYSLYSSALTFTNKFDKETKEMLEKVLKAATYSSLSSSSDMMPVILKAHLNLSLVLQQLNVEPEKQKEHTEWSVNWLRKNGKRMRSMEQFVRRSNQPPHPVYVALGEEWFEAIGVRENTAKEDDRMSKRCRVCSRTEPQVTLFRCSGCQFIFYCSKECQKANWKLHKESCRERALSLQKVKELKSSHSGKDAQKAADWIKWRDGSHFANTYALAHALGLHRDPSRGRTHIVFRMMEYTPKESKDIRHRFRVSHAGVYKLTDVYPDIERLMGLDQGEGQEYVKGLLEELDTTGNMDKVPMLDLSFGGGVDAWLGSMAIPTYSLRQLTYDPDWRKSINISDPAEPFPNRPGVRDVEHEF
ncbi:hypothetical protein EIP91_000252 [Steccherinum ochraceum]|uniref:MYND-type domain-containing protein n=1 Tax=Steccherinum ochraceum TaxID=92696 RepID=A0A4R0RGE4_9APHY|nr:hypothetical protein EIP91_000252 [Steccherinum ochraceum]